MRMEILLVLSFQIQKSVAVVLTSKEVGEKKK